ncbi:hypothetical protein [Pseudomonas fluorescens]|jgi:hypothetical protein|uniref:hypothetical protein n=1 Tax=Pseudomonas fluorescens TaxID=294 RepID=UPI00278B6CE9|nr:hypothetical protein [Pseudomonas fluorescens]MDP9780978.1 hypothetical protein [Pseudomonas fluorescens]
MSPALRRASLNFALISNVDIGYVIGFVGLNAVLNFLLTILKGAENGRCYGNMG